MGTRDLAHGEEEGRFGNKTRLQKFKSSALSKNASRKTKICLSRASGCIAFLALPLGALSPQSPSPSPQNQNLSYAPHLDSKAKQSRNPDMDSQTKRPRKEDASIPLRNPTTPTQKSDRPPKDSAPDAPAMGCLCLGALRLNSISQF